MTKENKALEDQSTEDIKFEDALRELEQVVRQLESGELSLDESLNAFRKGTSLTQLCRSKLDEVEQSITQLITKDNGELVEEAFPELADD